MFLPRSRYVFSTLIFSAALASGLCLSACSDAPPQRAPRPVSAALIQDAPASDDVVPRAEPRSRYGNPSSYEVFGTTYHVLPSTEGFVQRGTASWYGPDFHGKRTSSGEAYDMNRLSAAHKTLPLPCYVRVTNLDNGRAIIVRINDRGPFVKDRIIDLSFAAAKRLGVDRMGTARVEIRALGESDMKGSANASGNSSSNSVGTQEHAAVPTLAAAWYVQIGAYSRAENAELQAAKIRPLVGYPVIVQRSDNAGKSVFRVRVGPLANRDVAEKVQDFLEDHDVEEPSLVAP